MVTSTRLLPKVSKHIYTWLIELNWLFPLIFDAPLYRQFFQFKMPVSVLCKTQIPHFHLFHFQSKQPLSASYFSTEQYWTEKYTEASDTKYNIRCVGIHFVDSLPLLKHTFFFRKSTGTRVLLLVRCWMFFEQCFLLCFPKIGWTLNERKGGLLISRTVLFITILTNPKFWKWAHLFHVVHTVWASSLKIITFKLTAHKDLSKNLFACEKSKLKKGVPLKNCPLEWTEPLHFLLCNRTYVWTSSNSNYEITNNMLSCFSEL